MKTINMKSENIKKSILKLASVLFLFAVIFGCEDSIEFAVKADFTIDANVKTTSFNNVEVSTFETESTIDLKDKIDQIDKISTLKVTGVTLELMDYNPKLDVYNCSTDDLTGDLTVTLLSNNSNKEIYKGYVNLGTNNADRDCVPKQGALVVLAINPTEAKDLIENNKVKLKIGMVNGKIRSESFKIKITVKSETITSL